METFQVGNQSTIDLTALTGRRDTPHCPEMAAMSAAQRKLKLWRQNTRDVNNKTILKLQRNAILHAMRRKARSNTEERLDRMASEVERLHDGAKMFRAVREMTRRPATQLTLHDDAGRIISNSTEINTRVTGHFTRQFTDPTVDSLDAFTGEPSQLTRPITPEEVTLAIGKLNTGWASGHDDIPAEFLKCSAELLSHTIANIFNDALQHHELLDIGKGVLILVQKPGKPTGPLTSLRPIVLLSVLRKTLSLIVLSRIAPKVDDYMSSSQSWFRRGRSTADVVFGYRWLYAKAQRHRVTVEFLGIDLSRAFDTIRRDKLLDTLQTFLDESELRMIRFLLADTSLTVERGSSVVECRTRNQVSPRFESCFATVSKIGHFRSLHWRPCWLSCINEYLAIDSGGHVSDLVVARTCCMTRMLPGEAELVSEWTGLSGRAKSVKRFERSNGLDTALHKNYLYLHSSPVYQQAIAWHLQQL